MIQVTEPEINRQLACSIHYFTSAKITTSSSTPSHKSSRLLGYYRGQEGLFSCGHPLGWPQDIRMLWQVMTKPQKNRDVSIRKYWIKNPRKRLWSELHNIRTIGMFVFSLIFLFVSCQPLFFYCRVTCSMWPKTCLPISPQIYTIWIQYQRETGQLFLLLPSPDIQEEKTHWVSLGQALISGPMNVARRTGYQVSV